MRVHLRAPTALVDEPLDAVVTGLAAGERVELEAETRDAAGAVWRSVGRFAADPRGVVRTRTHASRGGTYAGTDRSGPTWSMAPADERAVPNVPPDRGVVQTFADAQYAGAAPVAIEVRAWSASGAAAETSAERWFGDPGVADACVRDGGLRGRTFRPAGPPRAAVLALGGSSGGIVERQARLLAARGYTVFALAYCGYEDRPPHPRDLDIEYFEDALAWFRARTAPLPLALIATSYGTQPAVHAAAAAPEHVDALLLLVPSHVLNMGLGESFAVAGCFLRRRGRPLPYLTVDFDIAARVAAAQRDRVRDEIALSDYYLAAWRDAAPDPRVHLPIEAVRAPVLLVSGRDDALWPSDYAAERLVERLRGADRRAPVWHVRQPGGHRAVDVPGHASWPCHLGEWSTAPPYVGFPLGGTPPTNGRAQFRTWQAVRAFLARRARPGPTLHEAAPA
ncbi:MAG: acyl-CoA thioesterase/bile acid-CoA:amino acid N-acyltransferase family protein [Gammaproteobacteria bacterium]|nr:acyl-CoA thioesterase/bile acid-CoA:amino acid N-acyltransferase family protein [Gammaproteobacteria bacterium]